VKRFFLLILIGSVCFTISCKKGFQQSDLAGKFPKSTPQELNYANTSALLKDMRTFAGAVKKLDQDTIKGVNDSYVDVYFYTKRKPLFTKIYPDPAGDKVYFIEYPKDAETGSNIVLKFPQKLPIVDSDQLEVQLLSADPQQPLTCTLPIPNAAAYVQDAEKHEFEAQYQLYKRFFQSGTYDFDALSVQSYRTHGYPFIVFELVRTTITDKTANVKFECR